MYGSLLLDCVPRSSSLCYNVITINKYHYRFNNTGQLGLNGSFGKKYFKETCSSCFIFCLHETFILEIGADRGTVIPVAPAHFTLTLFFLAQKFHISKMNI